MHALLQRQIRRHLGGLDLTVEPWATFIAAVDRSYRDADGDRALVEQAMEISSHELMTTSAELRGLVQAFPDLVLHLDAGGTITAQRGSAGRAFSATPGGLVGRRLEDLLEPDEIAAYEAALATTRMSGEVTTLTHVRSEQGAVVAHEIRLASLGADAVVAIVRDVTLARRSEEMRLAKEGAEAASVAKSAFLANMSHELRTPLNAILGYSELLAEDADPAAREDLDRIQDAGRRLLHIINAMLDIARIEAGRVEVETDHVDLQSFVAEVVGTARTAAKAKGLALTTTVDPSVSTVMTDRAKLKQVLANLLDNAVKFTEQGRVELVVGAGSHRGEPGVVLAVRDTGIGIAPEQRVRLFQDFAQVDESNTRRFGGTGLGLAISRRLCALIGGRVDVESTYGVGSTFSVWVPRTPLRSASDTAPVTEQVA